MRSKDEIIHSFLMGILLCIAGVIGLVVLLMLGCVIFKVFSFWILLVFPLLPFFYIIGTLWIGDKDALNKEFNWVKEKWLKRKNK